MLNSELFRGDDRLEAAARDDAAHIFKGCTGEYVAKIQTALNQLTNANLKTDGIYGSNTAAAVFNFKKAKSIINPNYQSSADDIVGKMTIVELDRELSNRIQPTVIIGRPYPHRPPTAKNVFAASPEAAASQTKSPSMNTQAIVRGNPYVHANARDEGLPPSIPPGRVYMIDVTVTPAITNGDVIQLEIINTGFPRGKAYIYPDKITRSTRVTVMGVQQTQPGNAGALQIQATLNGAVIATSAGFTVCAHPVSVSTEFIEPLDKAYCRRYPAFFGQSFLVGNVTGSRLESDSGSLGHLDQVQWGEVVETTSVNVPPFTSRGSVAQTQPINALNEQNPVRDGHASKPRQGPDGRHITFQLHFFDCYRCGCRRATIPNSGFEIVLQVKQQQGEWVIVVTKKGKGGAIYVGSDVSPDQTSHFYKRAMPGRGLVTEHPVKIPADYGI